MSFKIFSRSKSAIFSITLGSASSFLISIPVEVLASVAIPTDFSQVQGTNNLFYQLIGDSRPSNITNPSNIPLTNLPFAGDSSFANGSVFYDGPAYYGSFVFPYVQYEENRNVILLHPEGKFSEGRESIGSAISFESPSSGLYSVSGEFARANNFRLQGDGVDVVIAKNGDLDTLFFEETISSDHDVNPDDIFSGTGVVSFDFNIELLAGETINFITFVGEQGLNPDFDVTALQFNINPTASTPEPSLLFGFLGLGSWLVTSRKRK